MNKDRWVELFEQVVGRKPTAEEFMAGKSTGFDLKQIRSIADLATQSTRGTLPSSNVKKKQTIGQKIKHGLLGLLGLLLIASAVAYYYFDQKIGIDVRAEQFSAAVVKKDYDQIATLLTTTDTKWSKDEVREFLSYLSNQGIDLKHELEQLTLEGGSTVYIDDQGNKLFGLEETTKLFGIFQDYRVVTYPIDLFVTTDLDDLTVNEVKVEKDEETSLGEVKFLPHNLSVQAKTEAGAIETKVNLNLDQVTNNKLTVAMATKVKKIQPILPFDAVDISNLKVFVNGKEIGEEIRLLDHQEVDVSAQFTYEGETYQTEVVTMASGSDDEMSVALNLSNEMTAKLEAARKNKEEKEQQSKQQVTSKLMAESNIDNVTASSYLTETQYNLTHRPQNLVDGDLSTAWVEDAGGTGQGEYVTVHFKEAKKLTALRIASGYQKDGTTFSRNARPSVIKVRLSDGSTFELTLDDRMGIQELLLPQVVETRSVTIELLSVYTGTHYYDTCISEVDFLVAD